MGLSVLQYEVLRQTHIELLKELSHGQIDP